MGFFDFLDPGPNGRDTGPSPDIQKWLDADLSNLQFDSGGFPVGFNGPPAADRALQVQYLGNRATEQRRSQFFADALGALRQGGHVMESYRPGGAAALRSGIYGQQANLLFNIGQAQQTPDFLSDFRRDAQAKADIEARRAARIKTAIGIVNAAAGVVGAVTGAGGVPQQQTLGQEQQPQQAGQIAAQPMPSQPSRIGAPGPEAPAGQPSHIGAPATLESTGAGPSGSSSGGSPGPAPGGAPAGGKGSGTASPGGAAPSGGGGAMGAGLAPSGVGVDGNFTNTAFAAAGMRVDPHMEPILTRIRAADVDHPFYDAAEYAVDRLMEHAIWNVA